MPRTLIEFDGSPSGDPRNRGPFVVRLVRGDKGGDYGDRWHLMMPNNLGSPDIGSARAFKNVAEAETEIRAANRKWPDSIYEIVPVCDLPEEERHRVAGGGD